MTKFGGGLLAGAIFMSAAMAESFPGVDTLKPQAGLPDPLLMLNGEKIASKEEWVHKRRPELKKLFQHYMYGYLPDAPKIQAKIEREDKQYLGGKATKKEVAISFGPPGTPVLHLLLVTPNKRGPAPVFVAANFYGNHMVLNDPAIALTQNWVPKSSPENKSIDGRATDAGRGMQVDVWNVELIVDRGYGLATFYCGDVDPDKNDFTDGVHPFFLKEGEKRGPHHWGSIAAWAWGIHRAVDYLTGDADVDKTKIAAVGHSRLGKTAIVAGAFDERIALVIANQAGCGGTAPSRGKIGEPVTKINTNFPHWFAGEFKKFNDKTELLPFDQHCLVALVAPRPVLFTNAVEDTWANPAGQFEVLQAADPVYRLLDAGGLDARTMPENGKLVDSTLGYFIRAGKHSMSRVDWEAYLEFADKHFGKPAK